LARRLLNQRSASDDMERLMIVKLKTKCGAQFTAKMEGMLNDLSVGMGHAASFEKFCKENQDKTGLGSLDFNVQVLTTGHWPSYKQVDLILPPTMQRCVQVYKDYYDAKTSHRRLQWTHALGNCKVKGIFAKKKAYELTVTTLQAVVMLMFNKDVTCPGGVAGAPITFTALQEATAMPEDVLKRAIHSLACGKYKVLKRVLSTSAGAAEEKVPPQKVVLPTDIYAFNEQFT
jgi:cullin 1